MLECRPGLAKLKITPIWVHAFKPEADKRILETVQRLLGSLRHLLGNRHFALDEAQIFEHMEVFVQDILCQPGVVDNFAELPLTLTDRPKDDEVVPWLSQFLLQEEVHLTEKKAPWREDLLPDVPFQLSVQIELVQIARHSTQDRVGPRAPVERPALRQKLSDPREVQRPHREIPCSPPIKRCFLGQGLRFHHRHRGPTGSRKVAGETGSHPIPSGTGRRWPGYSPRGRGTRRGPAPTCGPLLSSALTASPSSIRRLRASPQTLSAR